MAARGTDPGWLPNWWSWMGVRNTYDNRYIKLDTIYATDAYLNSNPKFNSNEPRHLDIDSKIALSRYPITGEEFYQAILTIYEYRDNFTSNIKHIHELPDEGSWGGTAYLIKLEISENDIMRLIQGS